MTLNGASETMLAKLYYTQHNVYVEKASWH